MSVFDHFIQLQHVIDRRFFDVLEVGYQLLFYDKLIEDILRKLEHFPTNSGFSFLEVLVVLAVVAVLVSLAAPSLASLRQQHRLQSLAESFFNSMSLARSEALRRQQTVTLCPRASDVECDVSDNWQQGWLVFVDANGNARRSISL